MSETDDDRDRDIVRQAVEALDAIDRTFDHWLVTGEAFERGRQSAMREARTNVPKGRGYNEAYSPWMKRNEAGKLATIDQAVRFRLGKIIEHRSEVLAWRQTLTSNQRREWSHPTTVWRRFEAANVVRTDDDGEKKPSQVAQLKESLAKALDDNARLTEQLKRDGSLFDLKRDSAEAIAEVLVRNMSDVRAEDVAKRIRRKLKEKKKPAG